MGVGTCGLWVRAGTCGLMWVHVDTIYHRGD